ncbi:uncharacterized protein LOC123195174 isoform X1 [Mangifera indica]|uniref:uncharacterized protein LOC123195174 isoform X1 n=1 Tax=Mangifera indica TaxID=29780 RepID=UPI001CFB13BA|nr:uncharacterized protein LOC123195174 isoform X1 [Mangifera indica]
MERCFVKKPCCSFVLFSGAYIRMHTRWLLKSFRNKFKAHFSSRGCFGCLTKSTQITSMDEPLDRLKIQRKTVKKPSIDDFWSSSSGEVDNNEIQSRIVSSVCASNQSLHTVNGSGSTSMPSEFVNHGLLLWNQTRQQWLANKSSQSRKQVQEPTISWNASYESSLGTSKPFAQPVPLPETVDFLVDVWKKEGLYD